MKNETQTRKSIAMPESLWKKLEKMARLDNRSTSQYVRVVLQEHIKKCPSK